eukprot:4913015-Prymnesium_polylepis.1
MVSGTAARRSVARSPDPQKRSSTAMRHAVGLSDAGADKAAYLGFEALRKARTTGADAALLQQHELQEEEAAAAWGGGAPGPLTAAAETPEAPTVRMGRGAQRDRMSIAGAQQHGRGSTAGRAFIGAAPVDAWLAGQLAADEGAAVPPW